MERETRAAQAKRVARGRFPAAYLGRGPSNTPPSVPLMAQKQAQEVPNDRHGSA